MSIESTPRNYSYDPLKESNKRRFDSYSVRKSELMISRITFRDCRVHSFSDNLSQNSCIECFHSRGQHLCKFMGTKESVCIRKEFNSQRIGLGHQHDCRFIVLGHQYGRRDVMWKHPITLPRKHFFEHETRCFKLLRREFKLWQNTMSNLKHWTDFRRANLERKIEEFFLSDFKTIIKHSFLYYFLYESLIATLKWNALI